MILDYKDSVLGYPEKRGGNTIFFAMNCKECHQRSILAIASSDVVTDPRYGKWVKCLRCEKSTYHYIYCPAAGGCYYSYDTSVEWQNALKHYPPYHDARKEVRFDQVDKIGRAFCREAFRLYREVRSGDLSVIRDPECHIKIKRELIDSIQKSRVKSSAFRAARRERWAKEKILLQQSTRVVAKRVEKLKNRSVDVSDPVMFISSALSSDKHNVEIIFWEASRERGRKRPFISLQRQECGDPRMAGAW